MLIQSIELKEIGATESASKRRRVDKSGLKVIWIDLTAEDDLLEESSTDVSEDDIAFFEKISERINK